LWLGSAIPEAEDLAQRQKGGITDASHNVATHPSHNRPTRRFSAITQRIRAGEAGLSNALQFRNKKKFSILFQNSFANQLTVHRMAHSRT